MQNSVQTKGTRSVDSGRAYTMDMFFAKPGDVVAAKIDLKNGAVGIVPDNWQNAAFTNHFAIYEPDISRLLPEYFHRIIQADFFKSYLWRNKVGAEGRKEVKLDFFESVEIPLPSLAQQHAIVQQWRDAQAAAQATLLEANRLEQDAAREFLHGLGLSAPDEAKRRKAFAVRWSDFERWGMEWNQQRISCISPDAGKFSTVALGDALDLVQYGTSEKANQDGNGVPVLRMNNIKAGLLDVYDLKHIKLPPKVIQGLLLEDGDILVIRTNGSRDLVGTCAVFHETGEYVFASYLIRLRVNASKLNPDFAAFFLNSALGRSQVNAVSRQIMQNNINSEELRGLRLPLPPLKIQQTLVSAITSARQQAATKRAEAESLKARAAAEIEAAILGETQ